MGDTDALIDEARGYVHPDSAHALYLIGALADALEVKAATLSLLRSRVEALADDENDEIVDAIEDALDTAHDGPHYDCCFSAHHFAHPSAKAVKAVLRSLSDNKEQQ